MDSYGQAYSFGYTNIYDKKIEAIKREFKEKELKQELKNESKSQHI